jgi:WD40 repeat protein
VGRARPGRRPVATSGNDGWTRIWDLDTTAEAIPLAFAESVPFSIAFDSTGTRLAALDASNRLRIYALPLDEVVSIAQDRVSRTLTDAECRRFLHRDSCEG